MQTGGGNVERGHPGAFGQQLRRFATRRGAYVKRRFAFDVAERDNRQRGGKILHPPGAFFITGQSAHAAGVCQADAAVGKQGAAERGAQIFGVFAGGDVKRRFGQGGALHGVDFRFCETAGQHFAKSRRKKRQRRQSGKFFRVAADFAQNGVDETAGKPAAFTFCQRHVAVDGGVIRRVKIKNFRHAEQKRRLRGVRPGGNFARPVTGGDFFEKLLSAERGLHQPQHKSAVVRGKFFRQLFPAAVSGRIEALTVELKGKIANIHFVRVLFLAFFVASLRKSPGKYKCENDLTLLYFYEIYYSL